MTNNIKPKNMNKYNLENLKQGLWEEFENNRKSLAIGYYNKRNKVSYLKHYYFGGTIHSEGSYKNNLLNGKWTFYYPNGQISATGSYCDGYKVGEWKYSEDNLNISRKYNKNGKNIEITSKSVESDINKNIKTIKYSINGKDIHTEDTL